MRAGTLLLSMLAGSAGGLGCGPANHFTELGEGRGRVVSAETQVTYDRAGLEALRQQLGLTALPEVRYGAECLRVTYETVALDGGPTLASGLVCLPVGKSGAALVSYHHGTEVSDQAVPSSPDSSYGPLFALGFVSGGYAVSAPDYLGLGESEGIHPYLHAETEASASLDMIRASRHVARAMETPLSARTFLTGFSQGGHATLALLESIEERHADEVEVLGTMPISGPYALATLNIDAPLTSPTSTSSLYLAYLLLGYDRVYELFASPEEAFRDPAVVLALFDGRHDFGQVVEGLPAAPEQLLQPAWFQALRDDASHPLRVAARQNEVFDWRPQSPVRLCHGEADRDVPFENAVLTRQRMRDLGADVEIVSVGALDHAASSEPCTLEARLFFDTRT